MGRQIDVYAGLLSPEDYFHLKIREKQFELSENKRLYGDPQENWSEEEKKRYLSYFDTPEGDGPSAPEIETELEDSEGGWDPEDIEYVRGLSYEELQREIRKKEDLDTLPQGRDEDLRNRLLVIIDAENSENDEDEPDGS